MATSDSPLSVPDVTLAVAVNPAPTLSGGDSALSYSIASLTRDAEVTINTDGTYTFGAVGPELVILFDATLTNPDGTVAPILGQNTVITEGGMLVEPFPAMPGGAGYIIDKTRGYSVNTVPHTRGFESRTYYWPVENRAAANAYLLDPATDWDNKDWQIKNLWNMSDLQFGAADTDFFMVTWEKMYWSGRSWKQNAFLASNSIASVYGPNVQVKSSGTPSDEPLEEPYTTEFLYDQVNINAPDQGMFETITSSPSVGSHYNRWAVTGQTLHEETGATRLINSFTYPGFLNGFAEVNLAYATCEGELYKAAGPGAACRVVIADNADVDSATKKTILVINSWSNSQITANLRGGWWPLDDLAGKFLCVVGADNRQIASIQL